MVTTRSHCCEEIFNPTYKPKTPEEKDLFLEKQKFIYSVFDDCLLTDMGKSLVRSYKSSFDAQKIYELLQMYTKNSNQSTIDTEELLSYLTSTELDRTQWRGIHHAFILHWTNYIITMNLFSIYLALPMDSE